VQVIFAVSDVRQSAALYEQAFGWPRNQRIDYSNYIELVVDEGSSLGLYERSGYAEEVGAEPVLVPPDGVAPAYLYVRVDDAVEVAARLEAAGARPLSPLVDRSWGERAAWFADPDGNVVAVAQTELVAA
jgi:catechol 2,3-dioxygenase-like lactoylglutathione lyase family enzyme